MNEKTPRAVPPPLRRHESGTQLKQGAPGLADAPHRAVTVPPPPPVPTNCQPGVIRQPASPPRAQHVVLAETQEAIKQYVDQLIAAARIELTEHSLDCQRRVMSQKDQLMEELNTGAIDAKRLLDLFQIEVTNKIKYFERSSEEMKKDVRAVIALEGEIRGLRNLAETGKGIKEILEKATSLAQTATSEASQVTKLGGILDQQKKELDEYIGQLTEAIRQAQATLKALKTYGPRTSLFTILLCIINIALLVLWASGAKSPFEGLLGGGAEAEREDTSALPAMITSVPLVASAMNPMPEPPAKLVRTKLPPLPPELKPEPVIELMQPTFTKEDCNAGNGKYFPRSKIELNRDTNRLERIKGVTLWSCSTEGRKPITDSELDCAYECVSTQIAEVAATTP
jgi:hypothetical protein